MSQLWAQKIHKNLMEYFNSTTVNRDKLHFPACMNLFLMNTAGLFLATTVMLVLLLYDDLRTSSTTGPLRLLK